MSIIRKSGNVSIKRLLDFVIRESKRQPDVRMVLLGRPGAGKGTYGSKLSKFLNAPHISTGDLIREELRKQSPFSEFISDTISKGKLLGDDTVVELLSRRLQRGSAAGERGFILDGFPRTLKQAEILDRVASVDVVVNFSLEEEALVQKCLGRRMCGECGQVFSLTDVKVGEARMPAMPPPGECMSKMITRKDDNEESIKRRLEVYDAESKPVEEYYRKQSKLVNFDVCGSVEENWPRLLESLNLENASSSSSSSSRHSRFGLNSPCSRRSTAAL